MNLWHSALFTVSVIFVNADFLVGNTDTDYRKSQVILNLGVERQYIYKKGNASLGRDADWAKLLGLEVKNTIIRQRKTTNIF
jgi:hypothetical protein